jgi:hypothetical protein
VFLHPGGSAGHVVCPGCETSTHYFPCSGGPGLDPIKSTPRHITPNLCFCIRCDIRVTYRVLVRPGQKMSMHYFSCSDGPGVDPTKSALGHIM